MRYSRNQFAKIFSLIICLTGCTLLSDKGSVQQFENHEWRQSELAILNNLSLYSLQPRIDLSNKVVNNPDAVILGEKIFFDKRFSKDSSIACATCHVPEKYFTDGLDTAQGLGKTSRNTPTIVGASQQHWFFHDGRRDSLWSQALGPLENALEHGGSRGQFARLVYSDPMLRNLYETVFSAMPDVTDISRFPERAGPVDNEEAKTAWLTMNENDRQAITDIFVNIGKSLAAYETRIQPAPSRFDDYVKAVNQNNQQMMQSSLSKDEIAGLKLFIGKANCFICHNGPMFSDSEFHNVNTPAVNGKEYDWGRFSGAREVRENEFNCRSQHNDSADKTCNELKYIVSAKDETIGSMKTPGLRNVSKTAPYMHAGQYKTLIEVIKHYNDPPPLAYRKSDLLDIELNDREMQQLETFLHALDSDVLINVENK